MLYITRRERFSSAHKLERNDWSPEKNREFFGACSNPNWHGHNYELFVTIKGGIDPETGFVLNLKGLSKIVKAKVIDKLDHKNINLEVDFMHGKIASTEVLAFEIWHQLVAEVKAEGALLHCVKLVETENNYVEYFGA